MILLYSDSDINESKCGESSVSCASELLKSNVNEDKFLRSPDLEILLKLSSRILLTSVFE